MEAPVVIAALLLFIIIPVVSTIGYMIHVGLKILKEGFMSAFRDE